MKIAEMRSVVNEQNVRKGFSELPDTFPDWCIRNIYERRNGLPQTELPAEVRKKMTSLASFTRSGNSDATRKAQATALLAEIAAEQSAADMAEVERLKLRYQNLFS